MKRILKKTSFTGDVVQLGGGTAFAQALTLIAAPFLTRLYPPEAFGLLALFVSVSGILGVVACLRYELSIVLPETETEAANLAGLCIALSISLSLFIAVVMGLAGDSLILLINAPGLKAFLWLVPLYVFFHGIFLTCNYWNSRTRSYGRLAAARGAEAAISTSGKIGAGFYGYGTGGAMICASVLGKAFAVLVLAGQIWRDHGKLFKSAIRWPDMIYGLKRHRKFPLYSAWGGLLNSASWQLPAFLLAAFFSPAIVGFYALGFRILQMPMSVIGAAIGQVFFQRAAQARIDGTLGQLVEKVFQRLVFIGFFPMLMLALVGQDLYTVIFGSDWAEAGVYTQILSIWAFFWFISSPLSTLFSVLEKQDLGLRIQAAIFSTRLISLTAGGLMGSPRLALVFFSVSGVFVYGFMNLWILQLTGVSVKKALRILFFYFICFLPAGTFVVLLKFWGVNPWGLLGACGLCAAVYYLSLFKRQIVII